MSLLILGSNFGASRESQPNQPGICTLKQPRLATFILSKELYFLCLDAARELSTIGSGVNDEMQETHNDAIWVSFVI